MFPTPDKDLLPYAANFNARLVSSGVTIYQLTAGQVTNFTSLYTLYQAAANALAAAKEQGNASKSMTQQRNLTRKNLLNFGRSIYALVQTSVTISDPDKTLLGVKVRKTTKTDKPAPTSRVVTKIQGTNGRTVLAKLLDEVSNKSRRPAAVVGANLWVAVGAQAPATSSGWVSKGMVTKTDVEIMFDDQLNEAAATVWITAAWVGTRGQQGPAGTPVSVNLPAASANPVQNEVAPRKMKIAA